MKTSKLYTASLTSRALYYTELSRGETNARTFALATAIRARASALSEVCYSENMTQSKESQKAKELEEQLRAKLSPAEYVFLSSYMFNYLNKKFGFKAAEKWTNLNVN